MGQHFYRLFLKGIDPEHYLLKPSIRYSIRYSMEQGKASECKSCAPSVMKCKTFWPQKSCNVQIDHAR